MPAHHRLLRILFLATAMAGSARAQVVAGVTAAPPVKLAPVRVTADLWESPLERMPASVSVYDETALLAGAVRHFGDLVDQIPNLTWTGGTSRPRYLQIRGVGENSQYEGETPDASVRFLVDDFDFTGLGSLAGAFDVHQVEVLRGPQAGAFGANAAGGLVRIITQAPTPYWTGRIEGGVGGDGLRTGGVAVGGPLLTRTHPEQLLMRLALHREVADGFRRNVTLDRDTNARDEFSARLRLTANLFPGWRWEGAGLYSNLNNGYDEFALDNNGRRTFSNRPGRDEQEAIAGSLRGVYTGAAAVRFTTITNASRVTSTYSYDDDWTAASYDGFSDLRRRRHVVGQEFRLDSAQTREALGVIDRWTFGAYLAQTDESSAYTDEDPGNLRGLRTHYAAGNQAVFGQIGAALGKRSRLIFGLRAERVDLDGDGTKTRFRKSRGTYDPVVTFRPQFADSLWGGKLTLEHDLSSRHLAFASVTRGYKAGGINVDARISPPADPLTYATEDLWNYEIGLRGNWLEEFLTGEVTAFVLERRRPQVRDSAGFGGSYRFFTANGSAARVSGVEASGAFALTREWSLHGSCSSMESSLDRFVLANGSIGGGRRLANTPRYGYAAALRYRAKDGRFAQVERVARASQYDSNNHDEARRAFAVWQASLGREWHHWTVTLWGRNLTNRRYEKRVFFFGNAEPDYLETRYESRADPRQVGVSAAYRF